LAFSFNHVFVYSFRVQAAQKDFNGFTAYAERFVAEGWAVFLFDYRNFGRSEGRTRNLIDPIRHVQDYHAAVVHLVNTGTTPKPPGIWLR
jgi:alpha-beta hydrolase superfamily lysophospholipase